MHKKLKKMSNDKVIVRNYSHKVFFEYKQILGRNIANKVTKSNALIFSKAVLCAIISH